MNTSLNNHEGILTSVKWNTVSSKQEKTVALTTVVGKIKDENLMLYDSTNTYPKKQKRKKNQAQPGKINGKGKNKVKKESQMRPQ